MSFFTNLTTQADVAEEKDSLGGSRTLDTNIYKMKVAMAYLHKSEGGALAVNLHLKGENGEELKPAIYVTSGNAKGNKNYYENTKGEKQYLPGFNLMNSLALLTTGKDLASLEDTIEEKVVNVYNFESQAEVPTKVNVVMGLLDQDIYVGVVRQTVNKKKKIEGTNDYETLAETRDENDIDKFFCAREGYDKLTSAEIKAGAKEPAFFDAWKEKNAGKTRDKTEKTSTAAKAGAPAKPAAGKPSSSLFA